MCGLHQSNADFGLEGATIQGYETALRVIERYATSLQATGCLDDVAVSAALVTMAGKARRAADSSTVGSRVKALRLLHAVCWF